MVENQNLMRRLTISDWIAKSAAKTPNKVAYIYSLKGITTHQLTYRELVSKANHLANAFLKLGVSKGDRIAILSHNCPQFAVYLLAIAKIGAWITPLNFALKGKEIVEIIEHAEPSVFIVEDVLIDRILELHFTKQTIKEHIMINLKGDILLPKGWINFDEMWSEKESILEPTVDIAGSDVLNMIYTSGTEAMPKAVMNTHDNWNAAMITGFVDLHMTADTVTLISVPMYHVAGMHLMYNTLVTGGTVIMHYEPDVNEIVDLISNQKVNFIAYPPTVFVSLLKAPIPDAEAFVQKTLSNIRYAIVFGSPLPEAYINKLNNLLPNIYFMNYYGQSELTSTGTTLQFPDMLRKTKESRTRFENAEPVGRPQIVNEMKIVDENDIELQRGKTGEIVVRGPSIMAGYYKEPQKTKDCFKGGWHHTGDFGIMDEEGFIYFVDRKKDMVKSGGENVSTVEVEGEIYNHPNVAEATVVGLPHPVWSEALTAFVVAKSPETINPDDIINHCKENLAGYKVPKRVFIVKELPKNPSGKILKKELRILYKDSFTESPI